MALRTARLPGVRFEVVPQHHEAVLPRMDIAVFVGFAASGPLHIPVAVEDTAQFEEIFGSDLPLAWDGARGEVVTAYLAPVVRDFFRNGGRRCWIIRVASDHAFTAHPPIPGLARYDGSKLTPAFAAARSPGSWADALRLAAALTTEAVSVSAADLNQLTFDLQLAMPSQVVKGDLLRLWYASGDLLMVPVAKLDPLDTGPDTPRVEEARCVHVQAGAALWFRPACCQMPTETSASIAAFTHAGQAHKFPAEVPVRLDASPFELDWPVEEQDPVHIDCWRDLDSPPSAGLAAFPTAGSLVKVDFSKDVFWLAVEEVETLPAATDSSPCQESTAMRVRLTGHGLWQLPTPQNPGSALPKFAEKLTFELWARQGNLDLQHLTGLGFAPGQPRFWAALPSDKQLFGDQPPDPYADLWATSRSPRFPVMGNNSSAVFIPISIPAYPLLYAEPDTRPGTALERDGLDSFSAALFLDPDLADVLSEPLADQADFLHYTGPAPRRLRGIHAALSVEEATIIAVPDAAQGDWNRVKPGDPPPAESVLPLVRPEWWPSQACLCPAEIPRTPEPDWGQFLDCGLRVVASPVLQANQPDLTGSFSLTWGAVENADRYVLEESAFPNFSGARKIYRGAETRFEIYGYAEGDYYYHVRAEVDEPPPASSDWSNGVAVRIAFPRDWQVKEPYSADQLIAVQRALMRMCAARGDLFAVLTIPAHYCARQAQDYAHNLRSPLEAAITLKVPVLDGLPGTERSVSIAPLGYGEGRALSLGALYHPWPIGAASTDSLDGSTTQASYTPALRLTPPDGICCGVLARRAFERGVWVAPANEPLLAILGLDPPVDPAYWLDLQEARVNLLRHEPSGFLCLDADTLSEDPDWRPINVRRLISLLRRLALRYGPTYVFEPNSPAFQRLVKSSFEGFMDYLFVRSAFAGATPATSYQVSVQVTPEDIDAGRFIVELRVAPSLPMRFLTVRLSQSGDRSLVSEGG